MSDAEETRKQTARHEVTTGEGVFLRPGTVLLNRYEVLDLLGKGGMGSVFHVKHLNLQSELALKVLNRQADSTTWKRFENEAKTASRLDHPNLIKVHDSGLLPDGQPFFIMEIVKGETLAELIKKQGRLPLDKTLKIFIQVGFALAYAHQNGVVHRDLKPSNIMLSKSSDGSISGAVKVVDLGIAKLTGIDEFNQQTLTRTGEIFGSPLYMSPEQCIGMTVDHRSDLYSLGCSLFETLTGAPPLIGDTALSTMMKHQTEKAPTLREASLGLEFPSEVERLVSSLLEKEPDKRYANAQLVTAKLVELEQSLNESDRSDTFQDRVKGASSVKIVQDKLGSQKNSVISRANIASVMLIATGFLAGLATSWFLKNQETPTPAPMPKKGTAPNLVSTALAKPGVSRPPTQKQFAEPYSRLIANGKFKEFHFPEKSIGTIRTSNSKKQLAMGILRCAVGEPVVFEPAASLLGSSAVLERFRADDLTGLNLSDEMQSSTEILSGLKRLTSIEYLKISMNVGDDAIHYLDEVENLKRLAIPHCGFTSAAIAKLKRFSQLTLFSCADLKDVDVLLDKLPEASIKDLKVDDCQLTAKDLAKIAKATKLTMLSISGNRAINDNAFEQLRALNNLEDLHASSCALTAQCLKTLQSLKKLNSVTLPQMSEQDRESIKKGLNHVQYVHFDDASLVQPSDVPHI